MYTVEKKKRYIAKRYRIFPDLIDNPLITYRWNWNPVWGLINRFAQRLLISCLLAIGYTLKFYLHQGTFLWGVSFLFFSWVYFLRMLIYLFWRADDMYLCTSPKVHDTLPSQPQRDITLYAGGHLTGISRCMLIN